VTLTDNKAFDVTCGDNEVFFIDNDFSSHYADPDKNNITYSVSGNLRYTGSSEEATNAVYISRAIQLENGEKDENGRSYRAKTLNF